MNAGYVLHDDKNHRCTEMHWFRTRVGGTFRDALGVKSMMHDSLILLRRTRAKGRKKIEKMGYFTDDVCRTRKSVAI